MLRCKRDRTQKCEETRKVGYSAQRKSEAWACMGNCSSAPAPLTLPESYSMRRNSRNLCSVRAFSHSSAGLTDYHVPHLDWTRHPLRKPFRRRTSFLLFFANTGPDLSPRSCCRVHSPNATRFFFFLHARAYVHRECQRKRPR